MNLRKQIDLVNKRLQASVQNESSQANCNHPVKDASVEQDSEQLVKPVIIEVGTKHLLEDALMDCASTRLVEDARASDEASELVHNLSAISFKPKVLIKEYRAVRSIRLAHESAPE